MFLPCGERGSENLLNWRQLSPVRKTRAHHPVNWSSDGVFAMNFVGRLEWSRRAPVLTPGLRAVSVLPFVPRRPVQSNTTGVEEFVFCMVTLASVFAL